MAKEFDHNTLDNAPQTRDVTTNDVRQSMHRHLGRTLMEHERLGYVKDIITVHETIKTAVSSQPSSPARKQKHASVLDPEGRTHDIYMIVIKPACRPQSR